MSSKHLERENIVSFGGLDILEYQNKNYLASAYNLHVKLSELTNLVCTQLLYYF